jgi:hypothetical protein
MAEAHSALGKLAMSTGDREAAAKAWSNSLQAFSFALSQPTQVGDVHQKLCSLFMTPLSHSHVQLGGFSERCNIRFNHACVLALSGHEVEAHGALRLVLVFFALIQSSEDCSKHVFQGAAGSWELQSRAFN